MKRQWMWTAGALGAAGLLLSLWGFLGGGTAAEHFPTAPKKAKQETAASAAPAAEAPAAEKASPQLKYDVSNRPIRTKPLPDPFRLPEEAAESKAGKAASPAGKKAAAPAPAAEPVLLGIMLLGSDKRAVIEAAGETRSVTEGEKVGSWQVMEIREKSVILSGASGAKQLTI